jgi:hypothetical protein
MEKIISSDCPVMEPSPFRRRTDFGSQTTTGVPTAHVGLLSWHDADREERQAEIVEGRQNAEESRLVGKRSDQLGRRVATGAPKGDVQCVEPIRPTCVESSAHADGVAGRFVHRQQVPSAGHRVLPPTPIHFG